MPIIVPNKWLLLLNVLCVGSWNQSYPDEWGAGRASSWSTMTTQLIVSFCFVLRNNVIPIVMGARRQDYAAALPPHSYIHVDDFRSPRDLADYLHVLDANSTLYNEYFRWKFDYALVNHSYWCRLCGLLHVASEQHYVHWYTDYSQWWDGYRGRICESKWTSVNGVSWRTWNIWSDTISGLNVIYD